MSGIHLDFSVQLAACILEPVTLINDDVLPSQFCQARPVSLAHHEVVAGQQDIEAGFATNNLQAQTFLFRCCLPLSFLPLLCGGGEDTQSISVVRQWCILTCICCKGVHAWRQISPVCLIS